MAGTGTTRNAEKGEKKPQWVLDIETKSESYDPWEYDEKKKRRCIYKWPNDLVAASSLSRHRAPRTVSLGPYHHGEEHLQPMEHHKERALLRILHRNKIPLLSFLQTLQDVEQELRDSYEDIDLQLSPHLFLRMMLFDGCFLLEILRSADCSQPFFGSDGWSLVTVIQQDMLILENQIPLLVLEQLLEVEGGSNMNNQEYLHQLVPNFYGFCFPIHRPCLHILDIYRECLIGDRTALVDSEEETPISAGSHVPSRLLLAGKGMTTMLLAIPVLVFWFLYGGIPKHRHLRTATRLHEARIEFKKGEPCSGLTVTFDENNGVLTLPYIELSDSSAIFYMNLMAFERMHPPLSFNQNVTNYMSFMDELIDTAEDVNVLCSKGIVSNLLSTDEDAAKLFNAFSDGIVFCGDCTLALRKQWNRYAAFSWKPEVAYLKNYLQDPWSVASSLVGIFALVLAIIQTVFSGMQALQDGK